MARYKVQIREVYDPETEQKYRALYFDNALFDWGINPSELKRARSFCGNDPFLKKSIYGDISYNFIQCLSEVLEKELTFKEINKAIEDGYIDC
jgi:hypothetical protein